MILNYIAEKSFLIIRVVRNAYLDEKGPDILKLVVYLSIWKLPGIFQAK